jgi:hypothetical protein
MKIYRKLVKETPGFTRLSALQVLIFSVINDMKNENTIGTLNKRKLHGKNILSTEEYKEIEDRSRSKEKRRKFY